MTDPRAYYNEIDPYCAQWLRNLIQRNLIAPGDVDTRDIRDVVPTDLAPYTQCHFFAGIGGWSHALRLAAVPDHFPVWTGSCPCQPFSQAGKRRGFADERHLWPHWFHLINVCRPATIFGEQVAKAKLWLDSVFADLEGLGYACGAAVLPAAGVGAPHRRDRLWFIANSNSETVRNQSWRRAGPGWKDSPLTGAYGATQSVANTNGFAPFGASVAWKECDPWGVEPALGRVVDGVSCNVVAGALRGFGNAIVPQCAAQFIKAALNV